jgi:hypothetical protein
LIREIKNLIILPNAIGDIILSSELIKNCNYSGWVILVKKDFYGWVKKFLHNKYLSNITNSLNISDSYNIIIDLCGQDETIDNLKKVRSVNCLIGCYNNNIYDEKIDFIESVSKSSVFLYYLNLQEKIFGLIPDVSYPSNHILSKKEYDVLIYPFSGNKEKDWNMNNFLLVYEYLKEKNLKVKFLNPTPCNRDIENVSMNDILRTYDWNDSTNEILKSNILLTNDSSISHIGAFLGIFTISIFIKFNPKLWFPYPKSIGIPIIDKKNNRFEYVIQKIEQYFDENL